MADVRNIVLTGFMGTGKTSVGRALAERLGRPFVDSDDLIAELDGPIAEIFERRGEEGFRTIERAVADNLSNNSGLVIATGGRMLLDPDNAAALGETGSIVCLTAEPKTIVDRVTSQKGGHERPLLAGHDPLERVKELLAERSIGYGQFERVDTTDKTIDEVVDAVLAAIGP